MGALTAKPYAFSYRSWELKAIQTFDLTTAYCSGITIQKQGEKIIRILPNEISNFILPDSTRFFYDAEYQQRLKKIFKNSYYKNNKNGLNFFFPIPIKSLKNKLKNELNSINKRVFIFIGKYISIQEIAQIKALTKNSIYETSIYSAESTCTYLENNLKTKFYIEADLKKINEANNLLLLGFHPSQEDSLLSASIRKNIVNRNLTIFSYGHPKITIYKVINIGISFFELKEFFLGKNFYCKNFEKNTKNLLVFNTKFYSFFLFEKFFKKLFVHIDNLKSTRNVSFECKIQFKKKLDKFFLWESLSTYYQFCRYNKFIGTWTYLFSSFSIFFLFFFRKFYSNEYSISYRYRKD